jgi:hypothetical protein
MDLHVVKAKFQLVETKMLSVILVTTEWALQLLTALKLGELVKIMVLPVVELRL